ncbi:MAG: class I SAM-dependent methyltransferase [Candidatus Hodarchaeota archaeon]
MNINLALLCMQAAQRLADLHQMDIELPPYRSFFGLSPKEFMTRLRICSDFVADLIDKTTLSYRDLYKTSDIGKERLLLIRKLEIAKDAVVLDVGCGRGYTTIAAALQGALTLGIDLMNGGGRFDWWQNWIITAKKLQLNPLGIRGDILSPPLKSKTGLMCLNIHSIRNLSSPIVFVDALRQMARIIGPHGTMSIAESLPYAKTKAQEAHLQLYNLRIKHKQGDLPLLSEDELRILVEKAGYTIAKSSIHDFRLAATPPLFWLDSQKIPKPDRKHAVEEFHEAIAAIHKHGETSPPTILLTAAPQEKK